MENNSIVSKGYIVGDPDDLPEFYVDGVSNSFFGAPVSKITFHSVRDMTDEGNEVRVPKIRITMPTGSLIEFCRTVLALGVANTEALESGFEMNKEQIGRLLDGISISPIVKKP
jgi:hypothetical protein